MNWTRAKNVVWEELGGGALLVNPATGARWMLNATAAALWKLCDGRSSVELAQLLKRSSNEVARFCQQFSQMGLLQSVLVNDANMPATNISQFTLTRLTSAPSFKPLGLGNGPRRRPSSRGVSAPA